MFTKIIATMDGSPEGLAVVDQALTLVGQSGGELHLVHVIRPDDSWALREDDEDGDPTDSYEALRRRLFGDAIDRAGASGASGVLTHLLEGKVGEAIVALGEEIGPDLIILGHRPESMMERVFMGTLSGFIAEASIAPVLLVPLKKS